MARQLSGATNHRRQRLCTYSEDNHVRLQYHLRTAIDQALDCRDLRAWRPRKSISRPTGPLRSGDEAGGAGRR